MRFVTQFKIMIAAKGLMALLIVVGGILMVVLNRQGDHPLNLPVLIVGLSLVFITVGWTFWGIRTLARLNERMAQISDETQNILSERGKKLSDGHDDEFGDYARIFNSVADQVEQSFAELENRVKERTAELEDANASLMAILDSAGEAIAVVNVDMKITRVNQMASEILGYRDKNDLLGLEWKQAVCPFKDDDQMNPAKCLVTRAIVSQQVQFSGVGGGIRYQGRRLESFPVQITTAPFVRGGETVGAVIVFRDITEETAVDLAKTDFVSLASHQLRTPLAAIKWYVEALLMDMKVGMKVKAEWKDSLRTIEASSVRMSRLVNSLLNVSRIETGRVRIKIESLDVPAIVDRVLEELKAQCGRRKVKRDYRLGFLSARGDEQVVEAVAVNLISNAIKYSNEEDGQIKVILEGKDGDIVLTVSDNGIGIPKAQQPNIFGKLYRADNAKQVDTSGNGLGLYVTKGLLEAVGGSISFESEINRGTTFVARWPANMKGHDEGVHLLISE